MSRVKRYTLAVTTDADGNATVYSDEDVNGRVLQMHYVPHASTPLDTNADIDITGDVTGVVIANHDNIGLDAFTKAYKQPTHTGAGAASVFAGTDGVLEHVVMSDERIKLVVANGAATKSGTFYFWVG